MSTPSLKIFVITAGLGSLFFVGCASSNGHREESRNKIVQTSKMYCEFVNGDNNPDIDVAVNLAIGAKCDADRAFSITNYKTPSEINGILYCCGIREPKSEQNSSRHEPEAKAPVRKPVEKEVPAALAPSEAKNDRRDEGVTVLTPRAEARVAAPVTQPAPVPAAVAAPAPARTESPSFDQKTEIIRPTPQPGAPQPAAKKVEERKPNQIIFKGDPDLDE